MSWNVKYLPEALDDLRKLDGSQKILIRKAIQKVCQNPLPETEGGYGKLLGNKGGTNLSGFLKIKLRGAGLRIVYQLIRQGDHMLVIVIGAREDEQVYEIAQKRISKHKHASRRTQTAKNAVWRRGSRVFCDFCCASLTKNTSRDISCEQQPARPAAGSIPPFPAEQIFRPG